jgi:hypothetical protein
MTTPATEAAEAAEASAEAAEAAAEAAEAEAETETPDEGGGEGDGDTTVVVVDGDEGGAEEAQDDATNLDHEQRITRLEERVENLAGDLADRPDYESVRMMIPDTSAIVEAARSEAAAVAEATAEAHDEAEETGEPASVRVEEPPPGAGGDIVTVAPEVPEAAEETSGRRSSLFRW